MHFYRLRTNDFVWGLVKRVAMLPGWLCVRVCTMYVWTLYFSVCSLCAHVCVWWMCEYFLNPFWSLSVSYIFWRRIILTSRLQRFCQAITWNMVSKQQRPSGESLSIQKFASKTATCTICLLLPWDLHMWEFDLQASSAFKLYYLLSPTKQCKICLWKAGSVKRYVYYWNLSIRANYAILLPVLFYIWLALDLATT